MVRQGQDVDKLTGSSRFQTPPWTRESQPWQDIDATLEGNHLARIVDLCVDRFVDLSDFLQEYGRRGSPAYPPVLLLKAVVYQMACGELSPAAWHKQAKDSKAMKWLLFGGNVSRRRWYAFRDRVGPYLPEVIAQVIALARRMGLTEAKAGSLDGTFVAANASRHRMLNSKRLGIRCGQLEEAVAQDEAGLPVERPGQWMASTASGRAQQRERYRRAEEKMKTLQEKNQRRRSDKRKKAEKILVSATDPDSVYGRDKDKVFRPLYNVQLVHDLETPLVLAYEVFAEPSDSGLLQPMIERFEALNGHSPRTVVADSAYAEPEDLKFCQERGIDLIAPYQENGLPRRNGERRGAGGLVPKEAFVWDESRQVYRCPEGHELRFEGRSTRQRSGGGTVRFEIYRCDPEHCLSCARQTECTTAPAKGRTVRRHEHQELIDAHRLKMETPEARAQYRQRGSRSERIFADFKQHRNLRRFSGRGLDRVRTEVALLVLAHNLRALYTLLQQRNEESLPQEPLKIPP